MTRVARASAPCCPPTTRPLESATTWTPCASRREIAHIVVVDDGSTDATAARAREAGADQVITQTNAGKGAALTAAFRAARDQADIFLLLDADLGASAAECIKLLPPLWNDQADMTIGLLPPDPAFAATGRRGGVGLVVRLARWGIARRTGRTFAQPLSGQRAVRKAVLDAALPEGRFAGGFGVEVGLTLGALAAGFRVEEVRDPFSPPRHRQRLGRPPPPRPAVPRRGAGGAGAIGPTPPDLYASNRTAPCHWPLSLSRRGGEGGEAREPGEAFLCHCKREPSSTSSPAPSPACWPGS